MKVSNDFVDADAALKAAPFLTLCIKLLGVVFTLALLNTFATAKGP